MTTTTQAQVAVIGGSGFYALDGDVETLEIDTPWGAPSSPICVGKVEGVPVAFLARHGEGHHIAPHRVDSRANLWALRTVGVRAIVATFACGSLTPEVPVGTLVVPDQLIDRTQGRAETIHDDFRNGPAHATFADPYDPAVRRAALAAGERVGEAVHDGGTVVVINGPRFSTRAESHWYRSIGATLINMTQYPEAVIARELDLAYGAIGLVTDHDAEVGDRPEVTPVSLDALGENIERYLPRLRAVTLATAIALT